MLEIILQIIGTKYTKDSPWFKETSKKISNEVHEFRVEKLKTYAQQDEYHYVLMDDGGSNAIHLPVLMLPGTTFKHEYGYYAVQSIDYADNKEMLVICERTHK